MKALHDFERQVRAGLFRTVESVNPSQGAAERAIAAARSQAESQHLRQRRVRHWIMPLAAAAAAVVLVAGVALVRQSNLDDGPAGPSPSPQPSLTTTPEPSLSPSPSVTPNPSVPATGAAVAPSPTSTRPVPATKRVVIRPVDQAGQPAPGFTVTNDTKRFFGCAPAGKSEASSVAVNANIMWCGSSADYAVACWQAADPSHALCFRDPWSREIAESSMTTANPPGTTPLSQPHPMGLLLSDGDHCRIRNGGAWRSPVTHPTWVGYYFCTKNHSIYGPKASEGDGIDHSTPIWTVHVGSGQGPLSVLRVVTAYYVGTKGA
jgi:hypothetical protein